MQSCSTTLLTLFYFEFRSILKYISYNMRKKALRLIENFLFTFRGITSTKLYLTMFCVLKFYLVRCFLCI